MHLRFDLVSQELRESLKESVELGVKQFRSTTPSFSTRRQKKVRHRYSEPETTVTPFPSPRTPKTPQFDDESFLNTTISQKIGTIIRMGHGRRRNPILKHRKVPTPSQRQRMEEAQDKEER